MLKALATIESFGVKLNPHISLPAIIKPYAEELIKKHFSPVSMAHELFDTAKDYASLVRDFPAEINEILFKMKQGKMIIEINLGDNETMGRTMKSVGSNIAMALLLGFMLAGSIVMSILGKTPWMGEVMFAISSFFALWLLFRLFARTSL